MPAYWLKPEDRVNRAWFRPLEDLAARVAEHPELPPLNPAHFLYAARVERQGCPPLHCYRHVGTRGYINVDDTGQVWRYTGSDKVGYGRYAEYEWLSDALRAANLERGNLLLGHLLSEASDDVPLPPMPAPSAGERRAESERSDDAERQPAADPSRGTPEGSTRDEAPGDRADGDVEEALPPIDESNVRTGEIAGAA